MHNYHNDFGGGGQYADNQSEAYGDENESSYITITNDHNLKVPTKQTRAPRVGKTQKQLSPLSPNRWRVGKTKPDTKFCGMTEATFLKIQFNDNAFVVTAEFALCDLFS